MKSALGHATILAFILAASSALAIAITPKTFLADTQSRDRLEKVVPIRFGDWTVDNSIVPIPPSPDLQKVLDATYDETMALTYKNSEGSRIMLSLAYGRNQHKGMITHRPEVCYHAQGFKLTASVDDGVIDIAGKGLPVKRVVAAMGPRNEPITYWVMVGDEITEFGYPHRMVAIRYGLKGLIPDGVLVRVSSISANSAAAYKLQDSFIKDLLAAMPANKRHRLLGLGYN
jgi:EpsI family protein